MPLDLEKEPQSISETGIKTENLNPVQFHTHDGINSPKIPIQFLTYKKVKAGITATAGGGQAAGVKIATDIVEISVCATLNDSVTLPSASIGLMIIITNHGAASANIFPASGDKINGGAADAAKALAANATMLCYAYDSTNWEALTLAR